IDNKHHSAASLVAAGMWNPINFRRMLFSWKAHELVPFLNEFYGEIEQKLGLKLLHQKTNFKRISDENSFRLWQKQKDDLRGWAKPLTDTTQPFISAYAVGEVSHCGILDLPLYLNASKKHFQALGVLEESNYSWKEWQNEEAVITIACQGFQNADNPFFDWLPINANKGEILSLRSRLNPGEKIYNVGKFFYQDPKGNVKAGSTYYWNDLSPEPTEKGRQEILEPIRQYLDPSAEVKETSVGFRPTTPDRRPIIGFHPSIKSLAIFNGLGTKGVMLAPYFANQFVASILDNTQLDSEVDIQRFYKRYHD
ncbi:MAG: NAD(P)/FAD-dependent oxidoreductase, partial [Luteibaculum sp.]